MSKEERKRIRLLKEIENAEKQVNLHPSIFPALSIIGAICLLIYVWAATDPFWGRALDIVLMYPLLFGVILIISGPVGLWFKRNYYPRRLKELEAEYERLE